MRIPIVTRALERQRKKHAPALNLRPRSKNQQARGEPLSAGSPRRPPTAPGTLRQQLSPSPSPKQSPSPPPSAGSGSTFCSIESHMRRPSVASHESANALQELLSNPLFQLTNTIHPIFRRSNFYREARKHYDCLRPVLQLASRFLQTDAVLPIWFSFFYSEVEELEHTWHAEGGRKSYVYRDTPAELTEAQVAQTQDALQQLQHTVKFMFGSNDTTNCNFTRLRRKNKHPRIFLRRDFYRDLRAAIKASDYARQISVTFEIVCTIMHELAHAAVFTARGTNGHYYFPGRLAAEDGYEWELQVLGGLAGPSGQPDHHFTMTTWPNPHTVGEYLAEGFAIGVRFPPKIKEIGPEDFGLVPFQSIKELFQDDFWESVVTKRPPGTAFFKFIRHGFSFELSDDVQLALYGVGDFKERSRKREGVYGNLPEELRSPMPPLHTLP